jgi:hypothetical protein
MKHLTPANFFNFQFFAIAAAAAAAVLIYQLHFFDEINFDLIFQQVAAIISPIFGGST